MTAFVSNTRVRKGGKRDNRHGQHLQKQINSLFGEHTFISYLNFNAFALIEYPILT